jgi:membrane-bound metal-dependent hydrolase YbcI (DUF457 family)
MPLIIGHAFLGASVAALAGPAGRRPLSLREDGKTLVLAAALGVLPDLDLFFTWILGMGIKWHGGFTHSITLAAIVGWLCARFAGKGTFREAVVFGAATFSHGLLDAAVKKTYGGVELLWPFSARHYKLAILDYFAFYPDSKLDPMWILILRALQISFYEFVIFGSVFLLAMGRRGMLNSRRAAKPGEKGAQLCTPD